MRRQVICVHFDEASGEKAKIVIYIIYIIIHMSEPAFLATVQRREKFKRRALQIAAA